MSSLDRRFFIVAAQIGDAQILRQAVLGGHDILRAGGGPVRRVMRRVMSAAKA